MDSANNDKNSNSILIDIPLTALEKVKNSSYMAVIADIRMPVMDGIQLLSEIGAVDRDLPMIMITGHGDVALAVQAIRAGAYDFLEKPVDEEVLLASLKRAVEKRRLILENRKLQEDLLRQSHQSFFRGMVGCHPLMHRLYDVVEMVAKETDPVLLNGGNGYGQRAGGSGHSSDCQSEGTVCRGEYGRLAGRDRRVGTVWS
jgi:two-component system C4-dicarboxylate transport response regulator DctD